MALALVGTARLLSDLHADRINVQHTNHTTAMRSLRAPASCLMIYRQRYVELYVSSRADPDLSWMYLDWQRPLVLYKILAHK
jgi:hypothetical protein